MEGVKIMAVCIECGREREVEVYRGKEVKGKEEIERELREEGWFINRFTMVCKGCKERKGYDKENIR